MAGPLVQIYGARRIASSGTIIIFLGLVISAFATHIWMLYVFYGFLCGKCESVYVILVFFFFFFAAPPKRYILTRVLINTA